MTTTTRTIGRGAAALAGATMLAATLAQPASADGDSAQNATGEVSVLAVLDGSLDGQLGNQHRLTYRTDAEGVAWPAGLTKIQSYYCPSGTSAKITQRWTSSRCVSRGTSYLDFDDDDHRVSSTMRSAVIDGTLTSGGKSFAADLTLVATGEPTVTTRPPLQQVDAVVRGTIDDARIRTHAREASIHRWGR